MMATRTNALWYRYGSIAALLIPCLAMEAAGQGFVPVQAPDLEPTTQRFTEPRFLSIPVQSAAPDGVAESLRKFLSQEQLGRFEVVGDASGKRIFVRGSEALVQAAKQYIQTVDRPAAPQSQPLAQAQSTVRGYPVSSEPELQQRLQQMRQQYAGRTDIRIAADSRTRQLIIHAPLAVHAQIKTALSRPVPAAAPLNQGVAPARLPRTGAAPVAASNPNAIGGLPSQRTVQQQPTPQRQVQQPYAQQPPARSLAAASQNVQLRNIDWRELLRGMQGVSGGNGAISSPRSGELVMQVPSASGVPVTLRVNQQQQAVQINGDAQSARGWARVIQALDQRPTSASELQLAGRLGDAKATTITQTIAMLGGQGNNPQPLRTVGQNGQARWGGDVVNQIFQPQQRQPMQLAQADQPGGGDAAAGGGQGMAVGGGDATAAGILPNDGGSFLGPVRIEFVEGTDIFIVRGQKRDVDRVMQIINRIEALAGETEPAIEVVPLNHANSQAVADLVNELNETVFEARQGDISTTPLIKPNSVLLIGRPAGVEAVKKIIAELDVEAEASARFKVFQLDHLPAVDAERTINFLYNQQTLQQNTDAGSTLEPRVRAVADFRSNSIVVQGSPRDIEEIGALLKQIDRKDGNATSEVRVFALKNAVAEEVADVLNETLMTNASTQTQQGNIGGQQGATNGAQANTQARSSQRAMKLQIKAFDESTNKILEDSVLESSILSNVVVTFNERTNSVVVTAPVGSMDLIAEIIRQLDDRPAQEAEIRVITIMNGVAATLVDMLDSLFPQDDNQNGVQLQSAAGTGESTLVPLRFALDPRTNSIIATGNQADLQVVEAILLKLDASDVSRRRTFVYELLNQQASAVADAITQFVLQKRDAYTSIAPDTISEYEQLDQEIVVVAEDVSNKVIVSVSDRYYEEVMNLLRDLDKRPEMVMVKCLIAEVALNTTEEFGVELGIQESLLFDRSIISTVTGQNEPGFSFNNQPLGEGIVSPERLAGQALSNFGLGRTNSDLGYGGLVLSASSDSVSILLRALQEARRLDILSRPQVMMMNNQNGEVQVGSSVPFILDSQNNGFQTINTVQFVEVGLVLSVTPRISPDGLVVMDVLADKSELGSIEDGIPISISANGDILRQPQINRTRAQTFVSARDGQTVILGGLITKNRAAFERKVPYLADIPLVGKLFRTEGVAEERTELLIILTPHIVRDEADLNRINAEEYARMSWCLGNVIETHGDIGPSGEVMGSGGDVIYSDMAPGSVISGDGTIIQGDGSMLQSNGGIIQSDGGIIQGTTSPMPSVGQPMNVVPGQPINMAPGQPMMSPGQPMQSVPSGIQPIPADILPVPTSVSPPIPQTLGMPQARQGGIMLNGPLSQSGKQTSNISRATALISDGKSRIRSLGIGPKKTTPKQAVYRFEDLPKGR